MAKSVREVMSSDCECIGENETVLDAAKKLKELGVGSMPICGEDDRLKGMLTDRDIVVKVLAEGRDPASTTAGELGEGKPVTIGADDSISETLQTMKRASGAPAARDRRPPAGRDRRAGGHRAERR